MDRAVAGYGALGDMGVHLIDLVQWMFGDIERVIASSGVAHPARTVQGGHRPADAEDFCHVLADIQGGARLSLTVSRVARGLNEHGLEVYGEHGALRMRQSRHGLDWHLGELSAAREDGLLTPIVLTCPLAPLHLLELPAVDRLEITGRATVCPMVRQFLSAIENDMVPAPSLEDGVRAQTVLDAVLQSARLRGKAVPADTALDQNSHGPADAA